MAKLSAEEKFLKQIEREQAQELKAIEKQQRAEERERKRAEREAEKLAPKEKKPEKTEADLVRDYANKVIKNAIYHGRVDTEKFKGLEHTHTVSKNLWMDNDFFFSVVFQSSAQKRKVIQALAEKLDLSVDDSDRFDVQIVNGLDFAKALGIELTPETSKDYPTANIELMPFCLDTESV